MAAMLGSIFLYMFRPTSAQRLGYCGCKSSKSRSTYDESFTDQDSLSNKIAGLIYNYFLPTSAVEYVVRRTIKIRQAYVGQRLQLSFVDP